MINYNDKNELLANREKIEKIEFLDIKKVKEDYISYWKSVTSIPQEKIQKMLDWLETTDFYSAPASISNKNHGSFTGGLVLHHLLVLKVFEAIFGYIDDNTIKSNLLPSNSKSLYDIILISWKLLENALKAKGINEIQIFLHLIYPKLIEILKSIPKIETPIIRKDLEKRVTDLVDE